MPILTAQNNLYLQGFVRVETNPKRRDMSPPFQDRAGRTFFPQIVILGPSTDAVLGESSSGFQEETPCSPFSQFYASVNNNVPSIAGGDVYETLASRINGPDTQLDLEDKISFLAGIEHVLDEAFALVMPVTVRVPDLPRSLRLSSTHIILPQRADIHLMQKRVHVSLEEVSPLLLASHLQVAKRRNCSGDKLLSLYTEFVGLGYMCTLSFSS